MEPNKNYELRHPGGFITKYRTEEVTRRDGSKVTVLLVLSELGGWRASFERDKDAFIREKLKEVK